MITTEQVRQQLQNCGSSLRASDMKLLIDFILEKTVADDIMDAIEAVKADIMEAVEVIEADTMGAIEAIEAVKYSTQSLTQEQKKTARENIEASTSFLQGLPPEDELVKSGDIWIDTSNLIMYVRVGTSWVSFGNSTGGNIDDIIADLFDAMLEDDSYQFDGNYPIGVSPDNYMDGNLN